MDAISVATEAAHKAGDLILRHFRQPLEIHMKGPADVVTQVDHDAEDMIVRTIRAAFPEHGFLGEEGHAALPGADYVWVIDPLDGTRNYATGVPFFCTSIALTLRGRAVVGVIHDPLHGETFSAETGKGAYLNGARVSFARKARLEQAILYVGFLPAHNPRDAGLAVPMLVRLRPQVEAVRNVGSAALSLAYVACGRFDIVYQDRLSAWDMLAGALLVEEAGGVATDFAGNRLSLSSQDVIAANAPAFHASVLSMARQVLAERKPSLGEGNDSLASEEERA